MKAILVLDEMPKRCSDCPCFISTNEELKASGYFHPYIEETNRYYCKMLDEIMDMEFDGDGIDAPKPLNNCPLIEAPESFDKHILDLDE